MTKRFGAFLANDGIDLAVRPGEVMALLGENGAGKSTLMKSLFGVHRRDAGEIRIDGAPVSIDGPEQAIAQGIGMVFQQFTLLPALSVLENLLLAWPQPGFWRRLREDAAVLARLRQLAPEIDPQAPVRDLAVGARQLVELVKVLNQEARVVILDEPTSVLTPQEASRLHGFVRQLANEGRAVILITHKLADLRACADRVTVLRQGRVTMAGTLAELADQELIRAMVGERARAERRIVSSVGPARLRLEGLACTGAQPAGPIDLEIGRGEILGIAGVAGNGQWALAETVAGLSVPAAGSIRLDGESVARARTGQAFASPVAYIPEEPIRNAVIGGLDLAQNLSLRGNPAVAVDLLRAFDVQPPEPARQASTLSGGNLQKLVAARELSHAPRAVVACYPTMGLDLRASEAILARLVDCARAGAAILWISEELDDLLRLADRIAVLRGGRIVALMPAAAADALTLGEHMTGPGSAVLAA